MKCLNMCCRPHPKPVVSTRGARAFPLQNGDFCDLSHLSNTPGPAIMLCNK